ncbi:hypothetical protein D3C80_1606190 [compost metagenome]
MLDQPQTILIPFIEAIGHPWHVLIHGELRLMHEPCCLVQENTAALILPLLEMGDHIMGHVLSR